jgi:DNA-binding SARP family transcriptional activator
MAPLCVHLFGQFCVKCDSKVVEGLDTRRVQELFCYLLLYRDRPHPRETLANLLWHDCSTAQSKAYLRKALWQLQMAVDSQTKPTAPILLVDSEWIQVNTQAELWLDVAILEQDFAFVHGVPGKALDPVDAQNLRSAVDLYRGDLLEGWYHDWCLYERERLQQLYLAVLEKLMSYSEAHHEYEAGLLFGARILRLDHAHERTYRRMMRLHHRNGDRIAALRQYERCVVALDQELGIKPDELTLALYEQIRGQQLEPRADTRAQTIVAREKDAFSIRSLHERLKHYHTLLAHLQHEVQQDLQAVESILGDQR